MRSASGQLFGVMYRVIRRASSSCSPSSGRRPWPQFPAPSRYTTKSCSCQPFGSGPLVAPSFEHASQFAALRACCQAPWCGLDRCPRVAGRLAVCTAGVHLPGNLASADYRRLLSLVTLILLGVFVAQAVRRDLTAKDGTPVQARGASSGKDLEQLLPVFRGQVLHR
jgi:hypothetical protein